MRILTPPCSIRQFCHFAPLSMLAASTLSAHAAMLEIPSVKDGLSLGIYATVSPNFSHDSNKFTYSYGDPAVFGANGTIEQVLANQDRKDSDEQLRMNGLSWGSVEFYASQKMTPKTSIDGSILIEAWDTGSQNYGANWGVGINFGTYGEQGRITVGNRFNGLNVSQTGLGMLNTLNDTGTNINGSYTKIPNLTLNAYHMFAQASNINSSRSVGWRHSDGISASYLFDFAPRKTITLGAGYSYSKGHDNPAYYDVASKADAYLIGVKGQYNDWTVGLDYGNRDESYNGYVTSGVGKTAYGIKVDYEFTPRLKGTASYGHSQSKNNSPATFERMVDWETLEPYNGYESLFFSKVKQDRYSLGLRYQLYQGISLNGSVTSLKTKNHVEEGEFSHREQLGFNAGATFSF